MAFISLRSTWTADQTNTHAQKENSFTQAIMPQALTSQLTGAFCSFRLRLAPEQTAQPSNGTPLRLARCSRILQRARLRPQNELHKCGSFDSAMRLRSRPHRLVSATRRRLSGPRMSHHRRRDVGMPLIRREIQRPDAMARPREIYLALPGDPRRRAYVTRVRQSIQRRSDAGWLTTHPSRSDNRGSERRSAPKVATAGTVPGSDRIGEPGRPEYKASWPLILATALPLRDANSKDKPKSK